ncbi:response regulator [Streptomyces sp. bgisy031]|uniref:response regulator n=1 Tax=Streptomyces sp. bgisy031 TaxID=3413772 RepID=UPI003D737AE2
MAITVLIADDQAMVRSGFRMLLDNEPDIDVVAEAADGTQALEAARRLRPDVCLLDIRMPGLDGLEVTRRLCAPEEPDPPKVVIVTTFDRDEYVFTALQHGACGFLLKDASPALLAEAVRAAVGGESLVSPSITVRLLQQLAHASPAVPPQEPLSDRELEVVRLVARGQTNQEIAESLFLSMSTVKTHLANIQAKLAVRNRVEIAAWAWESRLMGAPEPP